MNKAGGANEQLRAVGRLLVGKDHKEVIVTNNFLDSLRGGCRAHSDWPSSFQDQPRSCHARRPSSFLDQPRIRSCCALFWISLVAAAFFIGFAF